MAPRLAARRRHPDRHLRAAAQLVGVLIALKPAQGAYSSDSRGNRIAVTPAGGTATVLGYDQASRLATYGTAATYSYNGDS